MIEKKELTMFVNISDLTMQGDADTFLDRVVNEVVPINSTAQGFIGYYGIKTGDHAVTMIRIFEDESSLDAATENAAPVSGQIGIDLGVSAPTVHTSADVSIASAFGAIYAP